MGWSLTSLIEFITELIATTIPIALAFALLAFFWNIVQGFGKSGDAKKRSELVQALLWIVLALFVVIALGGVVAVITTTFDL